MRRTIGFFTKKVIAAPGSGQFTYSLPSDSTTSAGVYNSSGVLVRTLWSNEARTAGSHTETWDKNNDAGSTITGSYSIRVEYNNIVSTWEGVLGNTSTNKMGPTVIKYLRAIEHAVFSGGYMYATLGFSESSVNICKISTSNIGEKIDIDRPINGDANFEFTKLATDGTDLYASFLDPFDPTKSGVLSYKMSDDTLKTFSSGVSTAAIFGKTYPSVVNLVTNSATNRVTGIAVGATYFYVFRGTQNQIFVHNKTTGAIVKTYTNTMSGLTLDNPRDPKLVGDTLFFFNGTDVRTATVSSSNLTRSTNYDKIGLSSVLRLDVKADLSEMIISHGGTIQQVRAYSATSTSTTPIWTLGQLGGYTTNSTAANDKFCFNHSVAYVPQSWIAYDGNDYWIGDVGNYRYIHFNSSRTYVENIQALKTCYQMSMDKNNTTRVFSDYMEFVVDYSKELLPTNGSWSLKANWIGALTSQYVKTDLNERNMFKGCATLTNGETYAFIEWTDPSTQLRYPELVRLNNNGVISFSGQKFDAFQFPDIRPNGDLLWVRADRDIANNSVGKVITRALTGFASLWPTWAAEVENPYPTTATTTPGYKSNSTPAMTSSGKFCVFSSDKVNLGFHLGAFILGQSSYQWQTCKTTSIGYTGAFPTNGDFDSYNGVEYAGGDLLVVDNYLLWNYVGEFWKNSQTNKWQLFSDYGLMIKQFGITGPEAAAIETWASPEMAGNAFSGSAAVVLIAGNMFVYHNDESYHSGIHRWKLSSLSSSGFKTIEITV